MNNFSIRQKRMIKNGKISSEEFENKRLREALQKAVNAEKVPENLRERISRIIRGN